MDADAPRDLSKGWCAEGDSYSLAQSKSSAPVLAGLPAEFDGGKIFELRAAQLTHLFTGLVPSNIDRQDGKKDSRNGAVDILLTEPTTHLQEVMEVTTTLDTRYQKSSQAVEKFVDAIAREYKGESSWVISLENGWEKQNLTKRLAPAVAAGLHRIDSDDGRDIHQLNDYVIVRRVLDGDVRSIRVSSRHGGVKNQDLPYLDALSGFLASSSTVQSKIQKVEREAERFDASRSHLFIGMSSTGEIGGLLPITPSYFTWGTFICPEPLTDLWLDGGTGEVYHWRRESGWIFHDMQS